MSHSISQKAVKAFIDKVPWTKVSKKIASTTKGQRLWPSQTAKNDADLNFRIDRGADMGGGKAELVLQPNKGAKDPKVKAVANKNSHMTLAKVTLDPKNDSNGNSASKSLLDSFKDMKN
ncbi:hypothetical protein UCRPC4_g04286 [Phaeomoniella chlamydospora]|uniref:Uncharacterized protein n=1 Tax=Phaeomoniella chlamydospora TaxID=158046 RepID=A0A0G2ECM7_PHACM|nr:hypothetical protein UCRPC4_g04286 [Phaeomoniella chlamydospora]